MVFPFQIQWNVISWQTMIWLIFNKLKWQSLKWFTMQLFDKLSDVTDLSWLNVNRKFENEMCFWRFFASFAQIKKQFAETSFKWPTVWKQLFNNREKRHLPIENLWHMQYKRKIYLFNFLKLKDELFLSFHISFDH